MELFVIIGYRVGVGFRLAYLLIKEETKQTLRSRFKSISVFLTSVKGDLQSLPSMFFLNDNETT